jgi:hypothetical protein
MNIRLACFLPIAAVLFISTALAQEAKTRSITSDDFSSQRPSASKDTKKPSRASARRASYRYSTKQSKVARRTPGASAQKKTAGQPTNVTEIGVTIWRLRPPLRGETGPKLRVKIKGSPDEMWTAERVGTDTVFRKGDRVRIAIESSVSGYLYVINSELYSTGRVGRPLLIFPLYEDEDNSVEPGMLIDIPDKAENYPYFKLDPEEANYAGELLTFIVSPEPLTKLKVDNEGYVKDIGYLSDVEEDSEVEVFSRTDVKDKLYTAAEAEAGCGAKTRELGRGKPSAKPCGANTRQLTREEPLPQSIYRIKSITGRPVVAIVSLNIR